GLAGAIVKPAGDAATQEASVDQGLLQDPDFRLVKVYDRRARCTSRKAGASGTAEPRPWPGRYDVDDLVATIHDHALILDHEEAVVAVLREELNQDGECRYRGEAYRPRHHRAGVNV